MKIENLTELTGAESLAFHCSSSYAELCFEKGYVRIDNNRNVWRIVNNGNEIYNENSCETAWLFVDGTLTHICEYIDFCDHLYNSVYSLDGKIYFLFSKK